MGFNYADPDDAVRKGYPAKRCIRLPGLKKHTYQYTKSSPFGISGVHFGQYQPNEDTISILQELGAANVRVGLGIPEYAEKDTKLLKKNLASLKKSGIRIMVSICF